jgi:hypothetical protein
VISHIVLLHIRPDLSEHDRARALETLRDSAAAIPEIRRVQLGRRIKTGLPGYEQLMTEDFDVALIVDVDNVDALRRYLAAPAHQDLGALFYTATTAALAYDYQIEDVGP